MASYTRLGLWLNVDINNSTNVRFRAVGKREKGDTSDYPLIITTTTASDIKVEDEYFELSVDADQLLIAEILTNNLVPYVQIQVQTGTVGATAGQIDAADVTFSNTQ